MLKILRETQAATFCHATCQIIHETSDVVWAEVTKQPQFEVLVQILTFYQSYRELEHSIYTHLPLPQHDNLFQVEIRPIVRKGS